MEQVNATGEAFLSHTKLNGRYTIRIAIGNLATAEKHVARVWELVKNEVVKLK
jgi:aromatic-L-amino-acid decarboxylase